MKTLRSIKSRTQYGEGGVEVSINGKAKRKSKCELGGEVDDVEVEDGEVRDDEARKKDQKTSKSKKLSKSKKIVRSLNFFTFRAKLTFTKLR